MNGGKLTAAVILLLLFAISMIPVQLFIGLYGTVLSPSFVGRYINRVVERIQDPEIHDQTFRAFVNEIVRSQDIRVPPVTYQLIIDSAVNAIDAYWVNVELARNAENVLSYMKGGSEELDLSLQIGSKKEAFLTRFRNGLSYQVLEEMRSQIPLHQRQDVDESALQQYVIREVSDTLRNMPNTIDLDAQFDESTRATLINVRKGFLLYSNLLMFLIPVVLLLPSLKLLPVTVAAPAAGTTLLIAGGGGAILTLTQGSALKTAALRAVDRALPHELRWVGEIVEPALNEITSRILNAAVIVTVAGFVIAFVGIAAAVIVHRSRR